MFNVRAFKIMRNQRLHKQTVVVVCFTVSFNLLGGTQLSSATNDRFPLLLVQCRGVIASAQILFLFDLKPIVYILSDKTGPGMTSLL